MDKITIEYIGRGSGCCVDGIGAVWKGRPIECTRKQFDALSPKQFRMISNKPKKKKGGEI